MKNLCKQILEKHNFKAHSIRKLNAGAASIIYIADTNEGKLVVKIRIHEGGKLEREYNVLKAIEKEKIAPKAYAQGIIDGRQYLIEDYVVGRRLPWRNIRDEDVKLVAKFFKKILSIKLDKKLIKIPIKKSRPVDKVNYAKLFQHLDKALANLIKRTEPIIHNIKIKRMLTLRHGDPNPHNFIISKGNLIAVDWEECRIGYPAVDIAGFFVKANLTSKQKEIFYKMCALNPAIKETIEIYVITGILGMVAWHVDRINQIQKGKLDKRLYKSLIEEKKHKNSLVKSADKIIDKYTANNKI